MALLEQARIINQLEVSPGFYRLVLESPEIARLARPGQFVHVRIGAREALDPLLRRPISLHDFDQVKGTITLLYQVVGRGTRALAALKARQALEVMGPLGKGFSLPGSPGATGGLAEEGLQTPQFAGGIKVLVVAGGIGIAPLFPLLKELKAQHKDVLVLLGARTRTGILALEEIQGLGFPVRIATDDGSFGQQGPVTALLEEGLEEVKAHDRQPGAASLPPLVYYACGPLPMLKAVATRLAKAGIPGQVSLEERMGCGVGACLACVCKVKVGSSLGGEPDEEVAPAASQGAAIDQAGTADGGEWTYRKVCVDGPVFSGEEVYWE